jgi:dipeptidyl-peptidase-3
MSQYNDIREEYGSKNTLITNRMSANRNSGGASKYLLPEDTELYKENMHIVRFVATVIHELLGHGTGKLFSETEPGKFNFDAMHPPLSPLTGEKIGSWYLPGQTYSSKFEDIAQTVEECRAILISAYLVDNKEILEIFGYNEHSALTADDLIYLSYVHLGIEGIRSLEHYNPEDRAWGQAHSQGYFAIFKHLLLEGNGVLTVQWDAETSQLSVKADRNKILSDGKPALGRMMCRLHVWRCTADAKACREFYEPLTSVEGEYDEWRQVVISTPEPRWKFVQANTFLVDGKVEVKEYEESDKGIIQSWVERGV